MGPILTWEIRLWFLVTCPTTSTWSIYFGTEPQSVKKTIKLIYKELKKLREVKLGPQQLKKAKQQLMGQLAIAQENNCNLMQTIAKSYQAFNKVESIEEMNQKILAISAEEIQEVAREIFKEDQLSSDPKSRNLAYSFPD